MNLSLLIDKWEKRKELFQSSPVALTVLNDCISDLKMTITGELRPSNRLDTLCHFKKHKGKLWKDVIEQDPDYVEWCLENISGFQLDEFAIKYLAEVEESQTDGRTFFNSNI